MEGWIGSRRARRRANHARIDTLVAAHARSRGLTVVTDNDGELGRGKGLKVENWRE